MLLGGQLVCYFEISRKTLPAYKDTVITDTGFQIPISHSYYIISYHIILYNIVSYYILSSNHTNRSQKYSRGGRGSVSFYFVVPEVDWLMR